MSLLRIIRNVYYYLKLKEKTISYKKNTKINMDDSVRIFPETVIIAGLGKVVVGSKSCIRGTLEIQRSGGEIVIGEKCYIGDHTRIWSADNITIGNNVLIAHNVNIFDNDTHPTDLFERREDAENIIWRGIRDDFSTLKSSPIIIQDDVWISCNSVILRGVKIGTGSIVAAGSIVTKDVPPKTLVAGNPAKVIKQL